VNKKLNSYRKNLDGFTLGWAKKIKAINLLGGKCSRCGNNDIFCLQFHHIGNKENKIADLLSRSKKWEIIEKEIKNCILLCANCHAENHFIEGRGGKLKINILTKLDITKCSKCGYSGENYSSLTFHHRKGVDKKFCISNFFSRKCTGFSVEDLIEEIKKCDIICKNCHAREHIKISRFEKFKDKIMDKVKNHKGRNKINCSMVKNLKIEGKSISEIAKIMNVNRSSIHYIFHKS